MFYYLGINIISKINCDGIDDETNTNYNTNNDSKIKDIQSSYIKFSGEVDQTDQGRKEYVFKADKEVLDKVVIGVIEVGKIIAKDVVSNFSTGFVGATVGAVMVKSTVGMPSIQRGLLVAGTAGVTTASVNI